VTTADVRSDAPATITAWITTRSEGPRLARVAVAVTANAEPAAGDEWGYSYGSPLAVVRGAAEAVARFLYNEFDWAAHDGMVDDPRPQRVVVELNVQGRERVLDLGSHAAPHESAP
jgi:hypothetical protein